MTRAEMKAYIPKLMEEMSIEDMKYEIAEYLECAGFADVYERKLKELSDEETIDNYVNTFSSDEEPDFYWEWHKDYIGV